jgi:hypothetical protein
MPAERIDNPKREAAIIEHAKRVSNGAFNEADVRRVLDEEKKLPLYKNWLYQCAMRTTPQEGMVRGDGKDGPVNLVHLSIKRLDRLPTRDWRDLQRIKNQFLGEECEAFELFPAESRLVDTANQTHLWGYDDPTFRAPFGFTGPRIVDDSNTADTGTKQRKLDR